MRPLSAARKNGARPSPDKTSAAAHGANLMPSLAALKKELAAAIEGEVRFDSGTLAVYAHDASNYRQVPVGVVIPRHQGDVAQALRLARENRVPILARGGGTSLGGQTTNAALVLDFSKYMNRVLAVDPGRRLAMVEPGVVQATLNTALASHGIFFAPDPATRNRCTIGGMVGNNSCGAHSAAYGKTAENLESLDVLLYDGTSLALGPANGSEPDSVLTQGGRATEVYARLRDFRDRHTDDIRAGFPRVPRRVSGYNLDELLPESGFNLARALVGSEGTLAVTLAATVRLVPRPAKLALAVLGFDDVFLAADQTPWLLAHRPQALEGFDHKLPELARRRGVGTVRLLPAGRAFLLVELAGETHDEARERAERVIAEGRRLGGCAGAACFTDVGEQAAVWGIRDSGLGAGAYVRGHPRTWPGAEDTAVAPLRLGTYLRRFDGLLSRQGLEVSTYYGHFGEGCVHARINFDLESAGGVATFRRAMREIAALVAEFGGSLSGEHGDGIARSELLPSMFGPRLIEAFREFKGIFDPDATMNPGVLVDPHPIDSHLKLGPSYRPRAVATHFDLSAERGLAGAALKCVGIGKCRKTDAGAMCPSYMVTREEIHSTRGRARLLFEALSGDLLPGGLTDRAVLEALDLCLACKACKTECPSSVDMAAYKAEVMAHYYREHRRHFGALLFGRIHEVARLASVAPRVANALSGVPAVASVGKWLFGIHPERALPQFAARTFRSWFKRRKRAAASGAREVVLFPDTFNNYFEPEVPIAAVEVLERAGFNVLIPDRDLCCGRPLYEQGMLDRAKWRLEEAMPVLGRFVQRGVPVVGVEPSCILTFRDELPAMFPNDPAAAALRQHSLLLDEFLAREAPGFIPPAIGARAFVHGHCHQKSLAGIANETALLSRAEGLDFTELDAGCCGMAGAFGYARDHFEISKAIGERVLFPAVRNSPPDTIVIADGFSCRAQIRQFCPASRPMHLAQALTLGLPSP